MADTLSETVVRALVRLPVIPVLFVAVSCGTVPTQPQGGGTVAALRFTTVVARMGVNTLRQLRLIATDSNGAVIENPDVQYSSSDVAHATVGSDGVVHGVGLGYATVKASVGAMSATLPVIVATHPVGTLTGTLTGSSSVGSRPFTVAVSSVGAVYVGRQDVPFVQRTTLPDTIFGDSLFVGTDPTDIAFNSAGSEVYVTDQFSLSLGFARTSSTALDDSVMLGADPYRVVVAPGDLDAYVTTNDGHVLDVSLLTHLVLPREWQFTSPSNGLAWNPDGVHLYATTYGGELHILNVVTGSDSTITLSGKLQDVVVAPDGSELFIANETGAMWVVDSAGHASSVPAASGIFALALSPDGATLYGSIAAGDSAGKVLLIDRASRTVTSTLDVGGTPRRTGFDPLGQVALIGNEAGYVSIVR